jgi:DNA-binding NtrC family response regulator
METRILIVDDDERICAIIARRLTIEGFSCVTANNGREALQYFYKDNFSLIISDIKMPELNGIELLKNVKALDQNMLVVMMTAYPEVDMAL